MNTLVIGALLGCSVFWVCDVIHICRLSKSALLRARGDAMSTCAVGDIRIAQICVVRCRATGTQTLSSPFEVVVSSWSIWWYQYNMTVAADRRAVERKVVELISKRDALSARIREDVETRDAMTGEVEDLLKILAHMKVAEVPKKVEVWKPGTRVEVKTSTIGTRGVTDCSAEVLHRIGDEDEGLETKWWVVVKEGRCKGRQMWRKQKNLRYVGPPKGAEE